MKQFFSFFILNFLLSIIVAHNNIENTNEIEKNKRNETFEENANVIIINDNNYEYLKKKFNMMLIASIAPWCGECQAFAPEYVKIATILKEKSSNIHLGQVDVTVNDKISEIFNIEAFPTLLFYYEGEFIPYRGLLNTEKILEYIGKIENIPYPILNKVEEINIHAKKLKRVIVSTLPIEDQRMDEFKKECLTKPSIGWINCHSDECVKYYNNSPIVYLRKFDEPIIYFPYDSKNVTIPTINKFVENYSVELGGKFDAFSAEMLFGYSKAAFLYFRDSSNKTQTEKDLIIKKVAKKYREHLYFFVLDIQGDQIFLNAAKFFEIEKEDLPRIQIINITKENDIYTYIMTKSIGEILDEKIIDNFVSDYLKGELIREPIGESIPHEQNEGFYILVSKTFKKIIYETKKSYINLFINENCEESDSCLALVELWGKLGQKYQSNEEVMYTLFNYGANELFELEKPKEFPLIMAFIEGKKRTPIVYKGKHKLIDIENWMAEQLGWTAKEEKKKEGTIEDL